MNSEDFIESLKNIFENLPYEEEEDIELFDMETIEIKEYSDREFYMNVLEYEINIANTKKAMIKLAKEIVKNIETFQEIEHEFRSYIPRKDTDKSVKLLAQYFEYYGHINVETKEFVHEGLKDYFLVYISNEYPIWTLGVIVAPILASGGFVGICSSPLIVNIVKYFFFLCEKVGIHHSLGFIKLNLNKKSKATVFVVLAPNFNFSAETKSRLLCDNILHLSLKKTPMIVFDNADIDSAVECAVDAAWKYSILNPISVDRIFIQEKIFGKFVEKFKNKVINIENRNTDPYDELKFDFLGNTDQGMDIEMYQKLSEIDDESILTIGSNYRITDETNQSSDYKVRFISFRHIDEGIKMVNNTVDMQNIGISVWSENIGLANEASKKLRSNNIWINSYGLFSPDLVISSGSGYMGGIQGFRYSGVTGEKYWENTLCKSIDCPSELGDICKKSRNSYITWSKTSFLERLKILDIIEDYNDHYDSYEDTILGRNIDVLKIFKDEVLDSWEIMTMEKNCTINGYNVNIVKEPKGVIIVNEYSRIPKFKILLNAIFKGNVVIMVNDNSDTMRYFKSLSAVLPHGILTIIEKDTFDITQFLDKFNECFHFITAYYNNFDLERPIFIPDYLTTDYFTAEKDINNNNIFTNIKNIWSN